MQLFKRSDVRELIEKNIDADPAKLALKLNVDRDVREAVCMQIKMLKRAKSKLPRHYQSRCWLPQLALEQATSEVVAAEKFSGNGLLAFDLTCGLGVDSQALARRYERVISIEPDAELAEVVRHNLQLLNIKNVEVVCTTAEEFIANWKGENPDLIYLDPDRRDVAGKKVVVFEDCSPNVKEMLPRMLAISQIIVIKCSPLFDADQAFAIFGSLASVEVISHRGECKELLITLHSRSAEPRNLLSATVIDRDRTKRIAVNERLTLGVKPLWRDDYRYLFVPDVALCRAKLLRSIFPSEAYIVSENGYVFADEVPEQFCGQYYEIRAIMSYRSKEIMTLLRNENLKQATLLQRDFDKQNSEIAKELKIKEGGTFKMAFTTIENVRKVIFLR